MPNVRQREIPIRRLTPRSKAGLNSLDASQRTPLVCLFALSSISLPLLPSLLSMLSPVPLLFHVRSFLLPLLSSALFPFPPFSMSLASIFRLCGCVCSPFSSALLSHVYSCITFVLLSFVFLSIFCVSVIIISASPCFHPTLFPPAFSFHSSSALLSVSFLLKSRFSFVCLSHFTLFVPSFCLPTFAFPFILHLTNLSISIFHCLSSP